MTPTLDNPSHIFELFEHLLIERHDHRNERLVVHVAFQ